ncbi:ABC transporter, ATP-binding protein [Aedoeadaptatus nemausensis]|uniref:Energy-coupling factor transporter ATP-binding protein EcfA2 n=1 Tax=Aedoeadaptatus nemausensis TaxID=2582829 RepID=A0A6V6Y4F3_9FIRM|nr:energy-coupling factor transporter ATPase [Peptoniphilus nemausensis]CAC9932025.1 ABC transporter, ATP-binding protein [Peptoniphilus nemausensis]
MSRISIRNVSYIYNEGMPFEKKALNNINLEIEAGEFIALIGHTGSGKSTLVQHLNGLNEPTSGEILYDGINYREKGNKIATLRQKVGLVFQYPEYQLFEETVIKDIAFGAVNQGLSEEEVDLRVRRAMERVGLSYDDIGEESPFSLSGGQKRRVAIAGILAMEPEVLVLDEPTAGLDPHGSREILREIKGIYDTTDTTIVLVSHSMEEVAQLATRMIVMDNGEVRMDDTPREIFKREKELESIGLGVPQVRSAMTMLKEKGLDVEENCITVDEALKELTNWWEARHA